MGELGLADNAGVKIFYASTQVQKLPPGHRFPMGKYEILRARLDQMPEIERILAEPASDGQLALVHTPDYRQAGGRGEVRSAAQRRVSNHEGVLFVIAGLPRPSRRALCALLRMRAG